MRRRKHFQICAPTVKRKSKPMLLHLFENTVAHREATLAAYIHLDEIRATLVKQIHEAPFIRLMFPGGNGKLRSILQPRVRLVILRR